MSEKTQIGVRVDKQLWEEFKDDVRERKGRVQGMAGHELEIAIREYIHTKSDDPTRNKVAEFEQRISEMEAEVFGASSDGGSPTPSNAAETHTRAEPVTEQPAPNAATDKKVRYLAHRFRESYDFDPSENAELPRRLLRETVKDEYGFRRDTAKRYVGELVDHFGLLDHPDPEADALVTESKHETLLDEQRAEADDKIDDL